MAKKLTDVMRYHEVAVEMCKRLVEGRPVQDWEKNLEIYLERKGGEGGSDKSVTNLTQYLTPFKDFLVKERVRPSL